MDDFFAATAALPTLLPPTVMVLLPPYPLFVAIKVTRLLGPGLLERLGDLLSPLIN